MSRHQASIAKFSPGEIPKNLIQEQVALLQRQIALRLEYKAKHIEAALENKRHYHQTLCLPDEEGSTWANEYPSGFASDDLMYNGSAAGEKGENHWTLGFAEPEWGRQYKHLTTGKSSKQGNARSLEAGRERGAGRVYEADGEYAPPQIDGWGFIGWEECEDAGEGGEEDEEEVNKWWLQQWGHVYEASQVSYAMRR